MFYVACVHPICFDCFSSSSWRGCIHEFCLAASTGPNRTGAVVRFEEEGDKVRVFLRTSDVDTFRRVCVATLDCCSSDLHRKITALGRMVDALGPDVSVASISGGSTILVEAFCEYLGSGYRQKLIHYPVRCLLRTASSVFGSLDGLAMTEFIVNRLKGAETRDWMSSRPALKKAILINDLSRPHVVDVVANIIGVWPLIVSSLKETGRKDDGDSLVVRSSPFLVVLVRFSVPAFIVLFSVSEEGNRRVLLHGPNGANEFPSAASSSWNL